MNKFFGWALFVAAFVVMLPAFGLVVNEYGLPSGVVLVLLPVALIASLNKFGPGTKRAADKR